MNSKKTLKKRIKILEKKVETVQDTLIGMMYFIMRMASTWDGNMDLIQKTFDTVAKKVNELQDIVNPLSDLDVSEPDKDVKNQ